MIVLTLIFFSPPSMGHEVPTKPWESILLAQADPGEPFCHPHPVVACAATNQGTGHQSPESPQGGGTAHWPAYSQALAF